MKLLTVNQLLQIHEHVISRFGGDPAHYDTTRAKLESIVAQQYPHFGIDRYSGVFTKAAMLLYFITKGHCFVDGNKRVGIQAALMLINLNGFMDQIPQHEGEMKVLSIAASQVPDAERPRYINNLAVWLQSRCIRRKS